jgi:hypothetical protein
VAAVARVATARVLLVVMAPWAGTEGAVPSPLVRSCGGVGATDVVGAWRGGAQRRGALCGGALPFSARSRWIKWRIEAMITLVRGSTILIEFFFLPLFSLVFFFLTFTQRLER